MKTRQGFVSNSSSSSFIVGIAKITDEKKFHKYLKDNNLKVTFDFGIYKVKDIDTNTFDVQKTPNLVQVRSFYQDVSLPLKDLKDDDSIFYLNIINDEGDYGQFASDKYGDIDYDIDLDYFNETEQKLYSIFDTPDIGIDCKTSTVTYGAGRNG